MSSEIIEQEEIVIEDNQLVCSLTGEIKKITSVETNLQSVIIMLNEEYGFDLEDMVEKPAALTIVRRNVINYLNIRKPGYLPRQLDLA